MPLNSEKLMSIKTKGPYGPVYVMNPGHILGHYENKTYVYKWYDLSFSPQSIILEGLNEYKLYENLIPLALMETLCSHGDVFKDKLETLEKIKEKVKDAEAPSKVNPRGIFITKEGEVLYATGLNDTSTIKELTM